MLKQKLILSYSSGIIFQLLQVAASLVVARVAGPTVLGTVAFGTAYVSLIAFIADLGLSTAHIKLVSEGRDFEKCMSTFTVLKFVTTSLFILSVIGMYMVQKYAFNEPFESEIHEYVVFISLAAQTVTQLAFIPKTTFMARAEQAKIELPNLLQGFLLQPGRIVLVLLGFGAIALATASLVSIVLVIPFYIYLARGYRFGSFDRKLAREYILISLPSILIGMSTSMVNQVDKVLLQFLAGSASVGFYTAGFKIGGFILLVGKSVRNLFFPLFSKAVAEGNQGYIKDKIDKFERFSFLFIMPAILILVIFSKYIILLLLGDDYMPSVPVMQIITASMFIMIVNMPFESVVEGAGKFKLSAILSTSNLILFVCLIFLFVSPDLLDLGPAGVAGAVFLSTLFVGSVYRFYAKRSCTILSHVKAARHALAGLLMFGVFYFAYEAFFDENLLLQVVFVLLFLLTFYSMYTLLGWMKKEDWQGLLSLVDFRSMKNYIVKEIRKR